MDFQCSSVPNIKLLKPSIEIAVANLALSVKINGVLTLHATTRFLFIIFKQIGCEE